MGPLLGDDVIEVHFMTFVSRMCLFSNDNSLYYFTRSQLPIFNIQSVSTFYNLRTFISNDLLAFLLYIFTFQVSSLTLCF